jgi:hypothetical protein
MFAGARDGDHRLQIWRQYRQSCEGNTLDQVVETFGAIPIKPRYLDFYTPETWPSVFEIVYQGHFCYSGICLITAATLWHLGFLKSDQLRFHVISNHISGHTGLVLLDNGNCYNFLPGEIVTEHYALSNSTPYDSHIIITDKLFS